MNLLEFTMGLIFGDNKHDFIYSRIRYCIVVKIAMAYITSHNYVKIKVDSCDSLSLEIFKVDIS